MRKTLIVPNNLYERAKTFAQINDTTFTSVIVQALTEFLNHENSNVPFYHALGELHAELKKLTSKVE